MKLFLYRYSLTENDQTVLALDKESAPQTREEFLRTLFSKTFSFDYRKGIVLKYHFLEEVDGVIYAAICRNISEAAAADKEDPFNVSRIELWKKATFLFNIKDDQQVIGLEAANGGGKPDSVIAGLTQTLNALRNGVPFRISVHSLPEAGSFKKAISAHPGKITSITFDLVTPNPPKVDDAIRKGLKELREQTGASRRKETIESDDGLLTDGEYIQDRAAYSEAGGGSAVVKSGREIVYDSKKKTRSINAPNELKPETKESKADYIRSVISRLIK